MFEQKNPNVAKLTPNRRVDLDLELLREEIVPSPEEGGPPQTRISIPLKGDFGVPWIESFYRLQWSGLDDVGCHLSASCREIYLERTATPKDPAWLSIALGDLKTFIALVNGEAASHDAKQAA
jgi:hypothetical protein